MSTDDEFEQILKDNGLDQSLSEIEKAHRFADPRSKDFKGHRDYQSDNLFAGAGGPGSADGSTSSSSGRVGKGGILAGLQSPDKVRRIAWIVLIVSAVALIFGYPFYAFIPAFVRWILTTALLSSLITVLIRR